MREIWEWSDMTLFKTRSKKVRNRRRATLSDADRFDADPPTVSFAEKELAEVDADERRLLHFLREPIEHVFSRSFADPAAGEAILAPLVPDDPTGTKARGRTMASAIKAPAGSLPYLAALYRFPLLSREQEMHLFRMMNYLKYRAECLRRNLRLERPQVGRLDQIRQYLKDAHQVRDHIAQANLRLVVSIAKTLVDRDNSLDELISDGHIPLLRAVEIFDFQRGTRFSTYATWAVRNALYRSTPRNRRQSRRFASGNEIALERLCDDRSTVGSAEAHIRRVDVFIERVLSQLENRDRMIVAHRFGLGGVQRPHRFREIAKKLNVSTERVRQLLTRALSRMHATAVSQSDANELESLCDACVD